MTNEELLQAWKDGEQKQKELWQEILSRKLYFQSVGIDWNKQDSSWRSAPGTTESASNSFFKGVKKTPMAERKGNTRNFAQEAKELLAGLDL